MKQIKKYLGWFNKKVAVLLLVPVFLLTIFFGLKLGFINPMVKGLDIQIIGGTFITNINKYVIKVGDRVNISLGDYIVVPSFAKKPNLSLINLDKSGVITIKGNTLIANKSGYATIGVLNKNRVLRKVTVRVVNPKINNMEVALSKPLKYFGDKAKIESTVNIDDFKKLEKGYKLNYSSTNDKVLKIADDTVEAVGVGEAKLISSYRRREIQTSIKILPKVVSIDSDKYISIEEGESKKIETSVQTLPENNFSKVEYKVDNSKKNSGYDQNKITIFGDSGLETSYGVSIDKDGNISAQRIGTYLIKISSGDKSINTVVDVGRAKFENLEVKNLQYKNSIQGDEMSVELGWDYNSRINNYRIYVKKDGDEDYELFTNIVTNRNLIPSGRRISELIKLDVSKTKKYSIYVVGAAFNNLTKRSNVLEIDSTKNSGFQSKYVKGIEYEVLEDSTIKFSWKPIDEKKYTYRIYSLDPNQKEKKYRLIAKNINKTSTVLKFPKEELDLDFYVVAVNESGEISSMSRPERIKTDFSD